MSTADNLIVAATLVAIFLGVPALFVAWDLISDRRRRPVFQVVDLQTGKVLLRTRSLVRAIEALIHYTTTTGHPTRYTIEGKTHK